MSKKLVAYFSASGVTAQKAELLKNATGADIFEIKPEVPYTPADIKWTNPLARCNKEWLKKTRPALAANELALDEYNVILLAFPIWYFTAPLIINAFLEKYDFSGKKIVLFATSGGSDMKKVIASLTPSAKGAELVEGIMLNGVNSPDELAEYAQL